MSTVTHHHLLTRVPVKLDIDNWNYASWVYFFENLCKGYEVLKYIYGSSDAATTSTTIHPTPKELKVDNIVLSWILMTLSDTLQARLVVKHPQSAKKAWDLITEIFNDNKQSRTIALKAELRSLKLRDLSIDACFRKIKSIATMLTSLGSSVSSDDVVTLALEGWPDKYENVCGILTHKEPFQDLKTARSMLTTKEMQLKNKYRFIHNGTIHATSPNSSLWAPLSNSGQVNGTSGLTNSSHVAFNTNIPYNDPVIQHQPSGPLQPMYPYHDPPGFPLQPSIHISQTGSTGIPCQETILPHTFHAMTFQDPPTYAWNMNTDGTLSRYKARLVANSSTQLSGIDVDETFSPVGKPCTIQTVLSLDTFRHCPVHQLDVKNAFLQGDLSEMVVCINL
ncbi:hybrid signal transduction histidine kinase M [Tanacetum coccineum]